MQISINLTFLINLIVESKYTQYKKKTKFNEFSKLE